MSEDLDFVVETNDAEVKELLKFPRLKAGRYRARLESVERALSPQGALQLAAKYKVLSDAEDINSGVGAMHNVWIGLPISRKPRAEQSEEERTAVSRALPTAGNWLSAHMPDDVLPMPRRTENGSEYGGEIYTGAELGAVRLKAGTAIVKAAGELWNNPDQLKELIGSAIYFDVEHKVSATSGKEYTNTHNFAAEDDGSKPLCNAKEGMWETPPDQGGEDVPELKPSAAAAKKLQTKKAKK